MWRAVVALLAMLTLGASPVQRIDWPPESLPIVANMRSRIYFWPGCPNYPQVSERHQERYRTAQQAEQAGYRAARNCPTPPPSQKPVQPREQLP